MSQAEFNVEKAADDLARTLFDGEPLGSYEEEQSDLPLDDEEESPVPEATSEDGSEKEVEEGPSETVEDSAGEEEVSSDEDETEEESKPEETTSQSSKIDEAPQTWPKDMRKHWDELPNDLKAYWHLREEQMLNGLQQYKQAATFGSEIANTIKPFEHDFQFNGVTPVQGISFLLNANRALTQGPIESRRKAYEDLGRRIGIITESQPAQQSQGNGMASNPNLQPLEQELQSIKQQLSQQKLREQEEVRQRAEQEIQAFASDPAHPYFDEVIDDMIPLLQGGSSLQEAYDLAVKKNPVTYQREIDRIKKEHEEFLKAQQAKQAKKAKETRSVNLKTRQTSEGPTEPLGTFRDTMKDVLRNIESRT